MNEYIFDKRKMKKIFKKYLFVFAGLFPIMLIINYALTGVVSDKTKMFLLVLSAGIFVLLIELIILKIKQRKEQNKEQDVVVVKAGAVSKKAKKYVNTKSGSVVKTDEIVNTKNNNSAKQTKQNNKNN